MVVVGDKIQSKNFFAIYKFSLPSFVEKKMQKMGVGWVVVVVVVVGVWVGCWWGVVFSNRKYFDKFMIIKSAKYIPNWGKRVKLILIITKKIIQICVGNVHFVPIV